MALFSFFTTTTYQLLQAAAAHFLDQYLFCLLKAKHNYKANDLEVMTAKVTTTASAKRKWMRWGESEIDATM